MGWLTDGFLGISAATHESRNSTTASAATASAATACAEYRLEPAIDYVGADIGADPVPAIDQEACCSACEQSRLCNAFTFVAASRDCWLKMRRRLPRKVVQPTTLVSGHRGRLKLLRRNLESDTPHIVLPNITIGGGGASLGRVARPFFFGDDDTYRDARFKLTPRMLDSNWVVRKAVGQRPAVLGKQLKQWYWRGADYLEIDIDIGSSQIAAGVVRLCGGYAKALVVDISFVIEGKRDDELPEQILGTIQIRNLDVTKGRPLPT